MASMTSSRERILDSFEDILIRDGERAATIDNVAAAAEVSKGGVLYHFPSKEALVDGLGQRLDSLSAQDLEAMAADPEGPARYYVRTSMYEDSPLDRTLVAMARLAQQGHPKAQASFTRIQGLWLEALEEHLGSRSIARAVKLMGDGLYYDAAFFAGAGAERQTESELQDLLKVVDLVVREGGRAAAQA